MQKFLFSMPSVLEIIQVADDQGKDEASEKAIMLAHDLVDRLGIVRRISDKDQNDLVAWGKRLIGTEAVLGGTLFDKATLELRLSDNDVVLQGAENLFFGPLLGNLVDPDFNVNEDQFLFATSMHSSLEDQAVKQLRDSFWDEFSPFGTKVS